MYREKILEMACNVPHVTAEIFLMVTSRQGTAERTGKTERGNFLAYYTETIIFGCSVKIIGTFHQLTN